MKEDKVEPETKTKIINGTDMGTEDGDYNLTSALLQDRQWEEDTKKE